MIEKICSHSSYHSQTLFHRASSRIESRTFRYVCCGACLFRHDADYSPRNRVDRDSDPSKNKQHQNRIPKNPISFVSLIPQSIPSETLFPPGFSSFSASFASMKQTSTTPHIRSADIQSIAHSSIPFSHCFVCPNTPSNHPQTAHKSAIYSLARHDSYFACSSLHSANCRNIKYPTIAITPSKTRPIHFESSIETPLSAGFSIMRQERTNQPLREQ